MKQPEKMVPAGSDAHRGILATARLIHSLEFEVRADPARMWAMTTAAALNLPGVGSAAITAVQPTAVRGLAATDHHARVLHAIEQRVVAGPGVDAARDRQLCRIDDLRRETRWHDFRAAALAQTPVRSIMCCPLFIHQPVMMALNLYAQQPRAFGPDAELFGQMFANNAAMVVDVGRREAQFRRMVNNRDVVGQAKGVLMERFDIDAAAAEALLMKLSAERQQPLTSIALQLVERKSAPCDDGISKPLLASCRLSPVV